MSKMVRSALIAAVFALCGAVSPMLLSSGPAYAVCNPGTPHCVMVAPGSRLAQLKAKLNNPGTVGGGDITCKNSPLCGIDTGDGTSPGALAVRPR